MSAASDILEHPLVYDIIVSDFGREAALEYLCMLANLEREVLRTRLAQESMPFFDEYRRIMFTAVADVAHCKRDLIAGVANANGFLTRDVLVGGGLTPLSDGLIERITRLVAQEAVAAFDRGYRKIRVVIPCNALSALAVRVHQCLTSMESLTLLATGGAPVVENAERLLDAQLSVHTVVDAVLAHVARTAPGTSLLLLGIAGTQELYREHGARYNLEILKITEEEQELINQAIIVTIGADDGELLRLRSVLEARVIEPRLRMGERITVVEACTDLSLGLGLNSMRVFAWELVHAWYGDLLRVGCDSGRRVS